MQVSFRTFRRSRAAARIALIACTAGALAVGGAAIAQTHTPSPSGHSSVSHAATDVAANARGAGSAVAQPQGLGPIYNMVKANFGIAPGAGFFLSNPNLTRGLNDFKAMGVHWIRSVIPWKNFQPTDPASLPAGAPRYNWKGVDDLVKVLHSPAYNGLFSLIVTVDNPPPWATQPSHLTAIPCASPAAFDLHAFAAATAALAQHMAGTASVFEVENSPNIGLKGVPHGSTPGVWRIPNPCGYTQLMKFTTPAVHALVPNAKVLVGGIGGTKEIPGERMAADTFLSGLYANGAQGYFDGVSYHPYSTPDLPCAPTAMICTFDNQYAPKRDPYGMQNGWNRMLNARAVMVAHGDSDKQVWITEFGGPTSGPGTPLTQTQQSTLLTAGFNRASQYPWIAEMCWFTYQDQPGVNLKTAPGGDSMGVVGPTFTHKLSFSTFQRLTGSSAQAQYPGGYWLADRIGTVSGFGMPTYGDLTGRALASPIVAMTATPNRGGYWLLGRDGGVFSFGNAPFYGSTGALHLAAPVISMTASASGGGYWFVASDGGIFSFGDARFFGSTGGITLNRPIVAMAATPTGRGYWLVASDGGIFSFGDARFFGSTGAIALNKPIVGMASTPTGNGYWLVASDGGIFSFGDAHFYGSTGAIALNQPIVGMKSSPSGRGYRFVANDGGIFSFGDAPFYGSLGGSATPPVVGLG